MGLAGIIGLLASLYYTRKAVKIADDSTRDTEAALAIATRNAEAASRLVIVTDANARKHLRAYFDFLKVHIDVIETAREDTRWLGFKFNLKNFGQTPANIESIFIEWMILELNGSSRKYESFTTTGIGGLSPSDTHSSGQYYNVPVAWVDDIFSSRLIYRVCILITYTDVFGEEQKLQAAYRQIGKADESGMGFEPGTRITT